MTAILVAVTAQGWGGAYVAPLLLIAVYMIAAEANSRLPGSSEAATLLRVWMPMLAVLVVFLPLRYHQFDAESLWPTALAATTGAVAALIAFRLPVERSQI